MRLTGLLEDVSVTRSGWACCLAAATIITSGALMILSPLKPSIQYSATPPIARYRRERSRDLVEWMFGNTRFTGIATALSAAPTTNWGRGRWFIFADYSLISWIMAMTGL